MDFLMFGYKNWNDFRSSNIGKWSIEVIFFISLALTGVWFGLDQVLSVVNEHIFSPPMALMTALGIIVADWGSGMYRGYHFNSFSTKKMQRIIPKLIANLFMFAIIFNIHKWTIVPTEAELFIASSEVIITFYGMMVSSVHFLSFISNCAESELIHGWLAELLKKKIDTHKKIVENLINK